VAAESLLEVYRAGDRLVAELVEATDPGAVLVFSMGGMGTNNADTPSMVLLQEFVYRWATGDTLLTMPDEWTADPTQVPIVPEGEDPLETISQYYATIPRTFTSRVKRKLRRWLTPAQSNDATELDHSLDWQPATRYRPHWATMRAFALPAFYDGRIRVNLAGREPAGIVEFDDYARTLDELEAALHECRNPRTGEPVVDHVERAAAPFSLDASEADLTVVWSAPANAFVHPELGLIGPAPFFRTGGHTGPYGFAFVSGDGIDAGDGGIRSAFDVAPTIAAMLDFTPEREIDGTSMLGTRV
jgi:predicted AlkP superfamily phosphohydrolase/phosphomutase